MTFDTDGPGIALDYLKFTSQVALPHLPSGFHHEEFEVYENTYGQLVARMEAHVLSRDDGEPVTQTIPVSVPQRPWWIPRALWRRIPRANHVVTLTVQPKWIYPDATVYEPLGQARRHYEYRVRQSDA